MAETLYWHGRMLLLKEGDNNEAQTLLGQARAEFTSLNMPGHAENAASLAASAAKA